MFTFGFSYIGIIYLLMLFIPNGIWVKNQPKGYSGEDENRVLATLERIGEVLCSACVLIFSDFNIHLTGWIIWLIISFFFMILYEIYWIHYFKSEKTLEDFYKPMFGFSVPGASLPVIAFFLLGIYGTNVFMIISSIILGIGHVGVHLEHYKKLKPAKSKFGIRIVKGILCVVFGLIFAVMTFFIGIRNFNYMNHYQLIDNGVDEGIYKELGGQEQYLLIRGKDVNNPVIVFLHGGPSSPESYVNYSWVNDLLDEYTVVDWDQRGCGRTYEHNINVDPNNETVNYEQALKDVDELVDYACNRFDQQQVIIVAHSYGTVLASNYIEQHSEKVSSFVSIAQVVSMDINNHALMDMAMENAKDSTDLKKVLEKYENNPSISSTMALRQEAFKYLPEPLADNSIWYALTTPYMGMDDFKWFLKQLSPMEEYLALNQQLYDALLDFNLYDMDVNQDIPVTYISGSLDYACPITTIQEFIQNSGVNRSLHIIDDCGHNVQYTKPHEVSEIIKQVLN